MRAASVMALLAMGIGLSAQEQPVFRSNVPTVPIYATVVDARGRLVPDLDEGHFSIADNGKPAAVSLFSNDPRPFSVVVMLDTSASMASNLDLLKRAAAQFLSGLSSQDRARVGAFNSTIQLSDAFTNDADRLVRELNALDVGNPTRLYDAVAASLDALRAVDGRRVVLIFTDGEDTASRIGFDAVLERARSEAVMVYSIGLESEYFNGQRVVKSRPSRNLAKIAAETGGGFFELMKTADLAPTFARVLQELRTQYLLGFTPTTLDGKTHKLEVRVARPDMSVRARKSYVAVPDRP